MFYLSKLPFLVQRWEGNLLQPEFLWDAPADHHNNHSVSLATALWSAPERTETQGTHQTQVPQSSVNSATHAKIRGNAPAYALLYF